MADALAKYRAALKRYRKDNPKVPYATAQKRVSAEMKSGKVSGAKKKRRVGSPAASKKTAIGSTRRKASAPKARIAAPKRKGTATPKTRMQKATKLVRDIEKLEIRRKAEKARQMKDVIQIEINRLHDQLDSLNRSSKRKSA